MRVLDCSDTRELAPEFALGVLDGAARADVVEHLDHCRACRSLVGELSEAADSVVLLAPEAEPPPGFERRTLAHLTGRARRHRWRTARLVAVAVAASVILSIAAVRVIDGVRSTPLAAPGVATVPMVGADGARVGQVDVADNGSSVVVALTVDGALADGAYRIVLAPDTAPRQVVGTLTVAGGRGAWSGSLPVDGRPAALELVDDRGEVPGSARLPTS